MLPPEHNPEFTSVNCNVGEHADFKAICHDSKIIENTFWITDLQAKLLTNTEKCLRFKCSRSTTLDTN